MLVLADLVDHPLGGLALVVTAGVIGLAVGSFLNVVVWRLPRKLSIVTPRSLCPVCERPLAWWELLPLLSYLGLGGRCRTCRARISPQYPLVEVATATLFVAAVWRWGLTPAAASVALFGSLLIAAAVIDAGHRIIPDAITLPGIAAGVLLAALNPDLGLVPSVLGLVLGGGLLLLMAVVTQGGMGGGDIKLAAMMGAFLGWAGLLVGLLLGFIIGAVAGGAMMVSGRKRRGDTMAFGPFLAAGALIAAFGGESLIRWYLTCVFG